MQLNYLPQLLYKQMCETELVMIRQPYMDIFYIYLYSSLTVRLF